MKMKKSYPAGSELGKAKKQKPKSEEELLREQLMKSADTVKRKKKPVTDDDLEKEKERNFLLQFSINNPVRRVISVNIRPYVKKFPLEFYELIYKLQGWATDGKKLFKRPSKVGTFTKEIIYLRFPPGTLKVLETRNPYIRKGKRLNKHFQYLTPEGEDDLIKFINEAMVLMRRCTNWAQFVSLLAKEYGHPYQTAMFDPSNQHRQENTGVKP